jgi:hypothetical protein
MGVNERENNFPREIMGSYPHQGVRNWAKHVVVMLRNTYVLKCLYRNHGFKYGKISKYLLQINHTI